LIRAALFEVGGPLDLETAPKAAIDADSHRTRVQALRPAAPLVG
jgi:hypothetical protein